MTDINPPPRTRRRNNPAPTPFTDALRGAPIAAMLAGKPLPLGMTPDVVEVTLWNTAAEMNQRILRRFNQTLEDTD